MLRQKLMCDADTSLITYNWLKGHSAPHPNFNVEHQCRDFEPVRQYAWKHRLDPNGSIERAYFTRPDNGEWVEFDEPPFDPSVDS